MEEMGYRVKKKESLEAKMQQDIKYSILKCKDYEETSVNAHKFEIIRNKCEKMGMEGWQGNMVPRLVKWLGAGYRVAMHNK